MQKLFSMLGLARRAGKLLIGRDCVMASARRGRLKLALYTADASPRHLRELDALGCAAKAIPLPCTMEELAPYIGKRSCIFALEDENFSAAIQKLI